MKKQAISICILVLSGLCLLTEPVCSQSPDQTPDIDIQVELEPELSASQLEDLTKLATGERAPGSRVLILTVNNRTSTPVDELYLDFTLRSDGGLIMEAWQQTSTPFSLRPGQTAVATIDDISRSRLRGVTNRLNFDGELTSEGRDLLRDLKSSVQNSSTYDSDPVRMMFGTDASGSYLPEESGFILSAGVYHAGNRQDGGKQIAQDEGYTTLSAAYQRQPGDDDELPGRDEEWPLDPDDDFSGNEPGEAEGQPGGDDGQTGGDSGQADGDDRQSGGDEDFMPPSSQGDSLPGRGDPPLEERADAHIYLEAPGGIAGRQTESIANSYPEFRWTGDQNQTYRIVIVEEVQGQDPESQIQGALGTRPASPGESASLLDFEAADVIVQGTSFQYPSAGVQPLQSGSRYFWQVFSGSASGGTSPVIRSSTGYESVSEIWSFQITEDGSMQAMGTPGRSHRIDDDIRELLVSFLGMNVVRELEQGNFRLTDIEVDDQQFSGDMAVEELYELLKRIGNDEVRLDRDR